MKGRVQQHAPLPGSEKPPAADAPRPDLPADSTEPDGPVAAAAPPPAPAKVEDTPPAPEAPPRPEDPRAAIAARAREQRAAELAEHAQDPEVAALDRNAGTQDAAPTDNAQPTDVDTAKAPAATSAGPGPGGDPVVSGIKISVYGEEAVVSEDEVRAAGIATLQKERAAEYRLQEASKAESKLRTYHAELDAYRDRLRKMESDLKAGKPPSVKDAATAAAPPSSGATVTVDDAKLAESARVAAEAIYRGDPTETAKALKALLADVAQGRTATPPPVDVDAVAAKAADVVDQRQVERTTEQKREAVNTTFRTEFGTVLEHPEAFAVAKTKFDALLQDPANAGKSWEDLAREAGKAALHRYPELKPDGGPSNVQRDPPAPTVDKTLEQRRTLKSRTVVRQPATASRAPAPAPVPTRSNKQFIADLRASRGLPP